MIHNESATAGQEEPGEVFTRFAFSAELAEAGVGSHSRFNSITFIVHVLPWTLGWYFVYLSSGHTFYLYRERGKDEQYSF